MHQHITPSEITEEYEKQLDELSREIRTNERVMERLREQAAQVGVDVEVRIAELADMCAQCETCKAVHLDWDKDAKDVDPLVGYR